MCCTIQKIPYPFKRTQFLGLCRRKRKQDEIISELFLPFRATGPLAGKINQALGLLRQRGFWLLGPGVF